MIHIWFWPAAGIFVSCAAEEANFLICSSQAINETFCCDLCSHLVIALPVKFT